MVRYSLFFWVIVFLALIFIPFSSAAHFIVGRVNDSIDGVIADDHMVTLWNPNNGKSDNLTDIIGLNGNSGTNNYYMIDCEMLSNVCEIGDNMHIQVIDSGDGRTTYESIVQVTGAGFDESPQLRLNSNPAVTLISPSSFSNLSLSTVNLTCGAKDLDGNLQDLGLYGNWSGWHLVSSKNIFGITRNESFLISSLTDGYYKWNCVVGDDLGLKTTGASNFTFALDRAPPIISSVITNLTQVCGPSNYAKVNCSVVDSFLGVSSIIIQAIKPNGPTNYTPTSYQGNTYFVDIPLNEEGAWYFNCIANDSAGNTANKTSSVLNVRLSASPDFFINANDISFSNNRPIEKENVEVNITVHNSACGDASSNATVVLFKGDPDIGGEKVGNNATVYFSNGIENVLVNLTWPATIGISNLFGYVDYGNLVNETNETNNKANKSIDVTAWQEFFGNISLNKLLASSHLSNLSLWTGDNNFNGNIFVADKDAQISWSTLQALGRNVSGAVSVSDFTNADNLLSMAPFLDSVSNIFTTDGHTPKEEDSFFVYRKNILHVPITNSSITSNFETGILWDTSNDSDGHFGLKDRENLVFVTKANKGKQGAYGIYDYEITIPVSLRQFEGPDLQNVYLYFDLN